MFGFEDVMIAEAIKPQTGAGARSADWISLKGYDRCLIVVHIAQGAADTTALTVDKAHSVAAAGESTGITMNNWWSCEDTPTTATAYTKGTAAASITSSATGSGSSIYLILIQPDELGAYDCIQLEAGASAAGNLISAQYVLSRGRYQDDAPLDPVSD